MIKKILAVCTIVMMSIAVEAQHGMVDFSEGPVWLYDVYLDDSYYGTDSIDYARIRADYLMEVMVDTVKGTLVEQMMTLEAGHDISRFCASAYKSLDTLLRAGASRVALCSCIRSNVRYVPAFYNMYYQNYPKRGKLTCTGRVCNTDFKYEESLPEMDWSIHESLDTLLGYTVQKATCRFRGRDYTAWFTSRIPVTAGPWKFSGLPGLILKVEDSRGHYRFTAKKIYRISSAVEIPSYLFLKTDRKRYMEAVRLNMTDEFRACQLYLRDIEVRLHEGMVLKKKTMQYDFMEKE